MSEARGPFRTKPVVKSPDPTRDLLRSYALETERRLEKLREYLPDIEDELAVTKGEIEVWEERLASIRAALGESATEDVR